MINARIDKARHVLILTADNEGRAALKDAYERGGYPYAEGEVAEALHEAYEFVPPENIPGAMTDAPILVDCDYLLYACGLLGAVEPEAALELALKHLKEPPNERPLIA